MHKNRPGSALIMVLLLSCLMSVLVLTSMKSIIWVQSMQQSVIENERRLRFAQGALECGIARARKDFDKIIKNGVAITASIPHEKWTAQLTIEPKRGSLLVQCSLKSGTEVIKMVRAELTKDKSLNYTYSCINI